METDPNGLLYMRARYYHPLLRRFLSADPIGFAGGLNWYVYAQNNPYQLGDPAGLHPGELGGEEGALLHKSALLGQHLVSEGVSEAAFSPFDLIPAKAAVGVAMGIVGAVVGKTLSREAAQAITAITVSKGKVLVDSNLVPALSKNPTLGGRIAAGEQAMVSFVTRPELRNAVTQGRGLKGVPRVLDDVPVLGTRPNVNTTINVRELLHRQRGRFSDGVIGGQALDLRIPLITNDRELAAVVRALGGEVR